MSEDDQPVQCWHIEPSTPCDWHTCRQPERLARGDTGTDPAESNAEVTTVSNTVWIVAQVKSFSPDGWALDWDLGGVFTAEDKARAQCTNPSDAVWPVELDAPLGRETVEPPGLSYPAAHQE